MITQYSYDPSKVSATFEVFPKDQYELKIGEPKAFIRQNNKGDDSYGIRVPLTIMNPGPHEGKRTLHTLYLTSDGAASMSKQFHMAAMGYGRTPAEEQRYNADYTGKDWSYDVKTGAVGDAWREMTGQRVLGDLDIEPAKDASGELTGEQRQKFAAWYPLSKDSK